MKKMMFHSHTSPSKRIKNTIQRFVDLNIDIFAQAAVVKDSPAAYCWSPAQGGSVVRGCESAIASLRVASGFVSVKD